MKSLFNKAKAAFSGSEGHVPLGEIESDSSLLQMRLSERDFFRFRKQRGVNLGSWFVLEPWITPHPFRFAQAGGQSDFDVAKGSHAKEVLEEHWKTWITQQDWEWLSEKGINAVRIPIGYYHLCALDAEILKHTDFHGLYDIFEGAWPILRDGIKMAYSHNIGVLLDIHAAPGGQNGEPHSGICGSPQFFSTINQNRTIDVLKTLMSNMVEFPNIIGIELLNEPHPPSDGVLQRWYTKAISEIRKSSPPETTGIPIYVGDCWRLDDYAQYISREDANQLGHTVLDHHVYRCFTQSDINTSAQDHIESFRDSNTWFPQTLSRAAETVGRAGGGLTIGEWSGALNPNSLRVGGSPDAKDTYRNYINAQLELYETHCTGWFFWTYKKGGGTDLGWSFRDAVENGVFPEIKGMRRNIDHGAGTGGDNDLRRNEVKQIAYDQHCEYWSKYPGHYEHWRFTNGFDDGWRAAYTFFEFVPRVSSGERTGLVSELGFTRAWASRRRREEGAFFWEYEHGFVQGVQE
ncbi:glycoside hydrolase, partial [Pluteus cervinus]